MNRATICAALGAFCIYLAMASSPASAQDQVDRLDIRRLAPQQQMEIQSQRRLYRMVLIDPATGETEARVSRDGENFSEPARVFIIGGTTGRQPEMLVRMGRVEVGQSMELGLGSLDARDRALSEPIVEIRLIANEQ
jgi:hypothetical protein